MISIFATGSHTSHVTGLLRDRYSRRTRSLPTGGGFASIRRWTTRERTAQGRKHSSCSNFKVSGRFKLYYEFGASLIPCRHTTAQAGLPSCSPVASIAPFCPIWLLCTFQDGLVVEAGGTNLANCTESSHKTSLSTC